MNILLHRFLCLLIILLLIRLFKNNTFYTVYCSSFNVNAMKSVEIKEEFTWEQVDTVKYKTLSNTEIAPGCYTSYPINQHRSSWCGCCYMVCTLQMIQDRAHVQIGKYNTKKRMYPWIIFDLQSMLDHYQAYKAPFSQGWNACRGGLPLRLLNSIEEQSCPLVFGSINADWLGHPQILNEKQQTDMNIKVKNSKRILPTTDVKNRILKNGPVILSISGKLLKNVDENGFVKYTDTLRADHAVSVVGWKNKNNENYWIARNSWGQKEVPVSIPKDMKCVSTSGNRCNIKLEPWKGDPENPGFVYIPFSYPLLNDEDDSPWFEADVIL
jgi:hypothetical protein